MQLRYRQQVYGGGGRRRRVDAHPRRHAPRRAAVPSAGGSLERLVVLVGGGSANLSGTLNASGSTFQLAFQQAAIAAFKSVQPGMTVNYGGGGSGKGRTDLAARTVNFAGSDSPIPARRRRASRARRSSTSRSCRPDHGLVQPVRRRASCSCRRPTIASIFQGKIKTWNDPAITADNPGATLPAPRSPSPHRSDGSGTTAELHQVPRGGRAGSAWTLGSGSTVKWPATSQGRQRQRRCGPDHQVHRRGHRLRRLLRRQGLRPDLRLGQEQGRQVRRAVAGRRPPPPPATATSSPT